MPRSSFAAAAVAAAVVSVVIPSLSFGQVPNFSLGLGIRETNNASGTPIGSNGGVTGSIEHVDAIGNSVPADGQFHTITFNFGTDPVTNPNLNTANGILDGALAVLEHLRINNTQGVTKPVSLFIDDVKSNGTLLTDFQLTPNAIPNNTDNVLFREPTFSGTTSPNLARNYTLSAATSDQPDGTTNANDQHGRLNFRFNTPDAVSSPTGTGGWIRTTTSSTSALGPVNPVIDISSGSTLTMRVAFVVHDPLYGYVGYDGVSGNNDWTNDDNWGRGTAAATTAAPNANNATALIDEPLPPAGAATPRTINLNADVKLQNLQFATAVPYTISGTNTLTMTRLGTDHYPVITVEAGDHTINAPILFNSDGVAEGGTGTVFTPTAWVSPGASLTITQPVTITKYVVTGTASTNSFDKRGGGTLTMVDAPYTTVRAIGGTLNLRPTANGATGTAAVSANATLSVSPSAASTTTITTGTVAANGQLTLSPTGGSTVALTTATVSAGGRATAAPTNGSTVNITTASLAANSRLTLSPTGASTAAITTISVPGAGVTLAGAPSADSSIRATTTNIGANASLKIDLDGMRAFGVKTLGINATGRLDLTNDGIAVDYAPADPPVTPSATFNSLRGRIIEGFAGGAWTGNGIMSSLLPAASNYAIGYKDLAAGSTFLGQVAADDSVVGVRYTLKGDADLSGGVTFDDLLSLAQNYNAAHDPVANGPKFWAQGDSDYNGIVNFDDLLSLAQNYGTSALSAGQLSVLPADFQADFALAQSLVPEPATLGLLGGLAAVGLRRRRR